ncbi:MAG: DUF4350 domain-containing protein [Actinomycetota bacterium]
MSTALRSTWKNAHPVARGTGVVVTSILCLNLLLWALVRFGGEGPSGRPGSSTGTVPEGLAAYADLLARSGHPVHQIETLDELDSLPTRSTLIALGTSLLPATDPGTLRTFVQRGGRLVIAGSSDNPWMGDLLSSPPTFDPAGSQSARPIVSVPEVAGASQVIAGGSGSWSDAGETLPFLASEDKTIASLWSQGGGRIVFLADPAILENQLLSAADNAAFGLAIAGATDRAVFFHEELASRGQEGLAAIPTRWRWFLAGALLAALLWMWANARRLGPPVGTPTSYQPPRRQYLDSLALTIARTRNKEEAVAPLKAALRTGSSFRAQSATRPQTEQAEEAFWLEHVLNSPVRTQREVMGLGRAFARSWRKKP